MISDYITLEDGTVWPNPRDPKELQWTLLHSNRELTKYERKLIVSYMAAYLVLTTRPSYKTKLPMIRRAMEGIENEN